MNQIMKDVDYKEVDRKNILEYIVKQGGMCTAKDIIKESGAEKLRVYPILFEEVQAGRLEVLEEENLGSPKLVKLFSNE